MLKSPPHTSRLRVLLEMFPKAKFVHIVRDPYMLFPSTIHLWKRLYCDQGLQKPNFNGLEEHIFNTLTRMYNAFERDRHLIGPGQFCEVRYENLIADPVGADAAGLRTIGAWRIPSGSTRHRSLFRQPEGLQNKSLSGLAGVAVQIPPLAKICRTIRLRGESANTFLRIGKRISGRLSQFSSDENGTVPFGSATVIDSPVLNVEVIMQRIPMRGYSCRSFCGCPGCAPESTPVPAGRRPTRRFSRPQRRSRRPGARENPSGARENRIGACQQPEKSGDPQPTALETPPSAGTNQTSIQLSAGVALPQTGPDGTLMSFSVDYEFAQGEPSTDGDFWVIERARQAPKGSKTD